MATAGEAMLLAANIQQYTNLMVFVYNIRKHEKRMQGTGTFEQAGVAVHCKLMDGSNSALMLSSHLLVPGLLQEMQRISSDIEAAGIDVAEMQQDIVRRFALVEVIS